MILRMLAFEAAAWLLRTLAPKLVAAGFVAAHSATLLDARAERLADQ